MESYKIIRCLLVFFICSISAKNIEHISLLDATKYFMANNTEIRHSQERLLLLEEKQSLHDMHYAPTLNPISVNFNPNHKTADLETSASMNLPTGGTLNMQYQKPITNQDRSSYHIRFDQPITHNTKLVKNNIDKLETELATLNEKLQYEKRILAFKKLYRDCVHDQLILEHQKTAMTLLKKNIASQNILLKHGEITKVEYTKQIANIEKQAFDILKLEENISLSLIKLKHKMGIPVHVDITLDTTIQFTEISIDPAHAIKLAVENSLEFTINNLKHQINTQKHKIDKRKTLPELSFYGQVKDSGETSAGLKIKYQVPNRNTAYSDAEHLLSYMQSIDNHKESDLLLKTELHQLLISLDHQKAMIAIAAESLKNQQTIHQVESIKFKYNEISSEEFQTASQQLQSAFNETVQAQVQYSNLYDNYLLQTGQLPNHIYPQEVK